MARVPIQNQQEVAPRPLPGVFQSAPGGEFGQTQARETMVAGQSLAQAGAAAANVALDMQIDANDARVDDIANGFISGSQFTLFTDKDAFYRKRGADAINGAQAATDKLTELKTEALGLASNEYQRKALTKMLNAQIREATNGISRHVSAQSIEYEKGVAQGRIELLKNQTALQYNDPTLVTVFADQAEAASREWSRKNGDAPEATEARAVSQRSAIFKIAISNTLQSGSPRQALALYDRVKDRLDAGDRTALETTMKSTATEVEAENLIASKMPSILPAAVKQYAPQIQKAAAEFGVDPVLASAVMAQESQGNKAAVSPAGARGLMQLMPGTASDLGVKDPHDPEQAIPGGTKYLGQQLVKYNGDQKLALMAYNWGPGNVDKWLKAGADESKVPQETRDYVRRVGSFVAGQTGVGFDKANVQTVAFEIMNDPGASSAVKAAAVTRLQRESGLVEAQRTAALKAATDRFEAIQQQLVLAPDSVPKGALAPFVDVFRSAGDESLAVNASALAAMEDTLRTFGQAPKSAQDEIMRTVAASMLSGKGKAVADALISGGKKDAAETGKMAGEELTGLRTAIANGARADSLAPKANGALDLAVKAGDFVKAREIADFYDAQVKAQAVNQAPPTQIAAMIADMRTKIEKGEQGNAAIKQLDAMVDTQRQQDAAFGKDALAAGAQLYSDLGPLPPIADLPARAAYAQAVSARRGGLPVLPFTQPEIATLRNGLEQATPEGQAKTFTALSALPAASIPGVAAALAGTNDTGNMLSRSYAAALSFYSEKDPQSRLIADQILGGARITKEMGDAGKKAPTSSQAWQTTLNDRIGNVFFDMKGMPAVIADAVASVYTYRMHKAGRQGETVDTTMLDQAITTVMGNTVTRWGQAFLPPVKGMETYEVDRAIRSITDADLTGLRTQEGDPITARVVAGQGRLTNAGQDGVYFVRIPDPRAGGDLRPIVDADGKAWRLDLRPFVERSKVTPPNPTLDESKWRRYLPRPAPGLE